MEDLAPDRAVRLVAMGLAGGRLAIGAGLWLAPRSAMRALGFGESGPQALALARIAASRDLVLGVWQVRALGDPAGLRRASVAVAACDGGDALAFAILLAAGERRAGIRGLAAALPAALVGAGLARALKPSQV